ncbi:hypothetical protein ACFQ6E_38175 [Streptomyces sp. NPDC056462]|uniref:hypothetical protein n=1 Tax=Streptomyces sp. NPDC056462 TaxID=3345826 RepID=UPI0036D075C2
MTQRPRKRNTDAGHDRPASCDVDPERGAPPGGGPDPDAPPATELPPEDPGWRPSGLLGDLQQRFGGQLRERHRSRLWFPHLMIRGAPGDTGRRPLWPPQPCWLSPDIHLFPAGSSVDLSRAVQSPVVGREYTVGVHVWNLGRFPAYGVSVRAWWVEPGFFSGTQDPRYRPHFIGGTFTELGDRDSGQAHRIVTLPQPWRVTDQNEAHECLIAVAEAFADPWTGAFSPNGDRHVGQRNLTLVRGATDTSSVLDRLGAKVVPLDRLEVHLGSVRPAPLKGAVARGTARDDDPRRGFGPLEPGPPHRIAELVLSDDGWLTDRSGDARRAGGSLRPLETHRLAEAIARLLGAVGTTASDLLASPPLNGARSAALHLSTSATGYTVVLTS